LAAVVLMVASSAAMAQWQWIDGTGRKVFSDTPPPAGIPDKNILKQPGARAAPAAQAPQTDAAAASLAPAAPAAPKPPAKDEQLEARKRQAEAAEEAKRKAEDLRIAQLRADNCERAKRAKATLDSGVRIATTNAKGEREIMDDNARNAETKRLNEIAQKDCGPAPARQQAQ
jgi:type IV secretory pathway VirB10-like protein